MQSLPACLPPQPFTKNLISVAGNFFLTVLPFSFSLTWQVSSVCLWHQHEILLTQFKKLTFSLTVLKSLQLFVFISNIFFFGSHICCIFYKKTFFFYFTFHKFVVSRTCGCYFFSHSHPITYSRTLTCYEDLWLPCSQRLDAVGLLFRSWFCEKFMHDCLTKLCWSTLIFLLKFLLNGADGHGG